MLIPFDKIKLIFSLIAIFLIPGWTFILISGLWRLWRPLQRWSVAIAASIAFYPLLFYITRSILPGVRIDFSINLIIILVGLATIIFMIRKNWREQFSFDKWEIYTLIIFGLTIFTRFWIIKGLPYPAWSDSLHHTMLTNLTAQSGRLPFTLEPYSSAALNTYHLGLYAITGAVQQISGAQAYTALLWTSQLINGLCAIGVFFILDRFIGRWASLTGVIVAGLFSFQPAWYVNWSRFTQLASQTIMLVAAGVTWHVLENIRTNNSDNFKIRRIFLILLAAGLNAAVFLLHFRVAIYYFPFLIAIVVYELISSRKNHQLKTFFITTIQIAGLSLLFILPALIPAINGYLNPAMQAGLSSENEAYFAYNSQTIFSIGLHPWLFWLVVITALIGLLSKHRYLVIITLLWIVVLFIEGNLYKLGISFLNFTNLSGITIGLYLPAGILIGIGVESLAEKIPLNWQSRFTKVALYTLFISAFIASFGRSSGVEAWRFFMTAYDRQAMDWIKSNTPPDSIFAINTYMWLNGSPLGTDGGYWIPYFTGRKTNTETMLLPTNQTDEMKLILKRSSAIVNYINGENDLKTLCDDNLDYIYLGKGNALSKPFDPSMILMNPLSKLVYQNPGVMIFNICGDQSLAQ